MVPVVPKRETAIVQLSQAIVRVGEWSIASPKVRVCRHRSSIHTHLYVCMSFMCFIRKISLSGP